MTNISFIIPVYNEEKRINKTFKALDALTLPTGLKLEEVIFVNDGSQDNSKAKIQQAKGKIENKLKTKVQIISYEKNMGKGYAIRRGMLYSKSDYALFFDADISTPLKELAKFTKHIEKEIDIIIGTRKNGKSTVIKHQPVLREALGHGFTILTQLVLGVVATDFTCGFKAFSKRSIKWIFTNSKINGWGYDPEILYLGYKYNFSSVEVPVEWANDEGSKVNLLVDVPRSFLELSAIALIHRTPSPVISTVTRVRDSVLSIYNFARFLIGASYEK